MKRITRYDLGNLLDAQMQTRTVHSPLLYGTEWEDEDVNENWIVSRLKEDNTGILIIECIPKEYFTKEWW